MSNRPFSGLRHRDTLVGPERLSMLGDAVFAIAITLLALEITVPEGLPDAEVAHAVRESVPAIGAYLLSFVVIGVLWRVQHGLFRLVATVDRWLLYCYFALLAVVAALPYPTRLISEYGETTTATAFYAGAITLAISLNCTMYLRLLAAPALAAPHATAEELKGSLGHGIVLVLVFATSIPWAFYSPGLAKYWWLLATLTRLLFRKRPANAQRPAEEAATTEEPA
ncbi:TMEM175 family protein [Streptomyces sp. NPDC002514]|uniref:TMEM175 family protein n=1 Tax=unclassified Streptomyces TaxID=2593676 RepID=UPI0036B76A2E